MLGKRKWLLVALALCLCAIGAGASQALDTGQAVEESKDQSVAVTTTSTTVVEAPTSTTTPPVAIDATVTLSRGASGPGVQALQSRLLQLHYDIPKPNGTYAASTVSAVMAFQKVTKLTRTGEADLLTLAMVQAASDPTPLRPESGPTRIEVDMGRQVLFLYKDGKLDRILSVSTGNNKRYCQEGSCGVAKTPRGDFTAERRIYGTRVSKLGKLYNPIYFKGGYAIHGSPSVPAFPASHGCVRISMEASMWFIREVPLGIPIHVVETPIPEVLFTPPPPTTVAPPPTTIGPVTVQQPRPTAPPVSTTQSPVAETTPTTTTGTTAPAPVTTAPGP